MSTASRKAEYTEQGRRVTDHWSKLAVTFDGALKTLEEQGITADAVKASDLHSLDMIHMGGVAATDELADLTGLTRNHLALDVGSGVGGPARRMADKYGAEVVGVELSETLCETATKFAELVGLQDRVRFEHASALNLPFDDETFDVVTMTHVAMQISEKERLFDELTRVVKPGGYLGLHELFSGDGELYYPLAWATEPSMSALEPVELRAERLTAQGFSVGEFIDHSEAGRVFHETNIKTFSEALSRDQGAQGLSTEVLEARIRSSKAMEKNLATGSLRVGMLVCQKR